MEKFDKERKFIHELLDGELSTEERQKLLDLVTADPRLKNEFNDLLSVVDAVETAPRLRVPPAFTSQVLSRLPAPKVSFRKKISSFLFGARVLRWNMATALMTLCIVVVMAGALIRVSNRSNLAAHQPLSDNATRTVTVAFHAPQAKSVSLAGDFNKWSTDKSLMKKQKNGIWSLEVPLKPGTYHYMFFVDGEAWISDPKAEAYRDDGFGNRNSVLRVSL